MRYVVVVLLSILYVGSLVCMVNDNNGSRKDYNACYSQEHEIDWDCIFGDSDDGLDIFDDLEQYGLYEQENDLLVGDSSYVQYGGEGGSERSHEVYDTDSTDRECTSVVHTTHSGDEKNIPGLLSDKDSALLETITYDDRIQDSEQRNESSLGSDVNENYQDTYEDGYIIRDYVDRPSIKGVSNAEITQGEHDGRYVAQCPVHGCYDIFRRKEKAQVPNVIRAHENVYHAYRYQYICSYCDDWKTYSKKNLYSHMKSCHPHYKGSISYGEHNGERFKDEQKKKYIVREYIDRTSLSEIPSENITYAVDRNQYVVTCPVQGCDRRFRGRDINDVQKYFKNHENADHKRKYVYLCNYCDAYKYRQNLISDHIAKQHQLSKGSGERNHVSSYAISSEPSSADMNQVENMSTYAFCSEENDVRTAVREDAQGKRYKDIQRKRYTIREYIDMPFLSTIPSKNIAYDANKGKYQVICPVQNCHEVFESKTLKNARKYATEHQNGIHTRRYIYMCRYCTLYSYWRGAVGKHVLYKHQSRQDTHGNHGDALSYSGEQTACSSSSDICNQEIDQTGVNCSLADWDEYNSFHLLDADNILSLITRCHNDVPSLYAALDDVGGESGNNGVILSNNTHDTSIQVDKLQNEPSLDSEGDEDYRDTWKKGYVIREYVDRPLITGVSEDEITQAENGKYVAQCPRQGCDYTPHREQKKHVKDAIDVHENVHHARRSRYICRYCDDWSTYNWYSLFPHLKNCHPSYTGESDTRAILYSEHNGERYKDTKRRHYIEREYIDRTSLSQIPSENIAYDSNKEKYQVMCPVRNCYRVYEAKYFGDAKKHARDHENANHKKRYTYVCNYCDFYGHRQGMINDHISRKHQPLQNVYNNCDGEFFHNTGGQAAPSSDMLSLEGGQAFVNSTSIASDANVNRNNSDADEELQVLDYVLQRAWYEYNSAHASQVDNMSSLYTASSNVVRESGANKRTRSSSETASRKHMRFQLEDLFE